ncbi:hypothetical protein [Algibacter pectinivorans]|uniref:Uncharacterized protein n=1 Tax=Algibacter pectinivorans TaxID=870482 RepID=A0A1I1PDV7_9FLAO|nr:hypothetical protein [Algibacter pectinivorans]SFD05223.1 hypothetical protein SAMN04487987_103212 [Algibacter pectinivorans]
MNVILSHPQDSDAIWLYLELKKSHVDIELVSPEELLMAEEWTQHINNDEDLFYIKTKKGLEITNSNLNFLFNRTQMAIAPIWDKAKEPERQYVQSEMNALMMSWLAQVSKKGRIYNPGKGYSLSGVFWSKQQWANAAFKAGFNSASSEATALIEPVLVVGTKVITNYRNKTLIEHCIKLSMLAQTPLLEIYINKQDETQFLSANTYPELSKYGAKLIAILKHIIYEN